MTVNEWIISIIALIGWLGASIQFILNRKYQKIDKALEKRFEVYLNFMNQIDEMNLSLRNDPNLITGIPSDLFAEIITGDEARIQNALLDLNVRLHESTKISLKPFLIMNTELNKVKLVASNKLLPLINDCKILITEYTDDFQSALKRMPNNSLDDNADELTKLSNNELRNKNFAALWQNIEILMREEIGYYKK